MNKNLKWILVLLIVTIVPAMLVYYFNKTNNFRKNAAPRPWFPMDVNAKGDTTYHTVPVFEGMNANGKMVSTAEMDGHVSIVEFFFTECPSICPIMNKQMARVFSEMSNNEKIRVFSYTIDPERDQLDKLSIYAQNHNANLNQWFFIRTPIDSLINFANWGIRVPAQDTMLASGDIPHTDRFAVVDWNRNIRGYYTGTDSVSVNKMMNDLVLLLSEKDRLDKKAQQKRNQ